jgi:hypothetical protein
MNGREAYEVMRDASERPEVERRAPISQLCHEIAMEDWVAAGFKPRFLPDYIDRLSGNMVFVGDWVESDDDSVTLIMERGSGTSYDEEHFWINRVARQELPDRTLGNNRDRQGYLFHQLLSMRTKALPIDHAELRLLLLKQAGVETAEPSALLASAERDLEEITRLLDLLGETNKVARSLANHIKEMRHAPIEQPDEDRVLYSAPWNETIRLGLLYFKRRLSWGYGMLSEPEMSARRSSNDPQIRNLMALFDRTSHPLDIPHRLVALAEGSKSSRPSSRGPYEGVRDPEKFSQYL